MKEIIQSKTSKVQIISAILLSLLTACNSFVGTLEIGIESTQESNHQARETAVPTGTVTQPVEQGNPSATATAVEAGTEIKPDHELLTHASALHVAFVKDHNVWLSIAGQEAVPLTHAGGVVDVDISDDGTLVAFSRQDSSLWVVASDGSEERPLVMSEDFSALEPNDPGTVPYLFEWVPGSHTLAFNTRQESQIGLLLNDDLHLVDAGTGQRSLLLPPGEGGKFYFSPDGRQIAVGTPERVILFDSDGTNRRELVTYTRVITASEVQFYAQPVWARDSSTLRVAIPPVEPFADPPQPTSLWELYPEGRPARMLGTVTATSLPMFSPDLGYIAYLQPPEGATHVDPWMLFITDLASGEAIQFDFGANSLYEWSPDSQHLAFLTNLPTAQAHIGALDGRVFPVLQGSENLAINLRWVDATRYLLVAKSARGWDLILGEISGTNVTIAGVVGDIPAYDFTGPPPATETSPEPSINAEGIVHPADTRTGVAEVDAVIDVILANNVESRLAFLRYTEIGCTTAEGLGGPPKCEAGEAEGTLLQVFPVLASEGMHVRPEAIETALAFEVSGLYAVYRLKNNGSGEDHWRTGEYGLIFVQEINDLILPLTVFVDGGRIVSMVYHYGYGPRMVLDREAGELLLPPASGSS